MPSPTPKAVKSSWLAGLDELDAAERLVLRGLRLWLVGLCQNSGAHWTVAWNEFACKLGAGDGKAAVGGLAHCVKALQIGARRKFRYHHPCCRCVGPDESTFLCFIAACQHHPRHARALAEWMAAAAQVEALVGGGEDLAHTLARHLPALPERHRQNGESAAPNWPADADPLTIKLALLSP